MVLRFVRYVHSNVTINYLLWNKQGHPHNVFKDHQWCSSTNTCKPCFFIIIGITIAFRVQNRHDDDVNVNRFWFKKYFKK
jgi:hypothetical protein